MPKYVVPSDCGTLADLIFSYLSRHRGQEQLRDVDFKVQLKKSLEFLQGIPDEAKFADFDLLEEFQWNQDDLQTIRAATQ